MARKKEFRHNTKGIGEVAAVVILVAVTIVAAVAISFWMGGVTGLYTRYEKIEISSAYAVPASTIWNGTAGWTVVVNLKNTGPADATIESALINKKPLSEFSGKARYIAALPLSIRSGQTGSLAWELKKEAPFTSGTAIEITVHSAVGQEYVRTIILD